MLRRGVLLRLLLRIAVTLRRALLRPLLLGLLGPLLRAGDLPLGAAAQRVLVGVEVLLDLCLLVAVAGGARLVLPGCGCSGCCPG